MCIAIVRLDFVIQNSYDSKEDEEKTFIGHIYFLQHSELICFACAN